MKKYFSKSRGFTLIELLVVIAIIAILSAVVLASISGARGKARDGKRISDISQIQLALEQYFDKNRKYPVPATGNLVPVMSDYISVLPKDPSTGELYTYATDSNNLDYVLKATLESSNAAISDGLTGTFYTVACATAGATDNKIYCVGPK